MCSQSYGDCKFCRIIEECNDKEYDMGSESPEDEEDFKLKVPDAEEMSDEEMKPEEVPDDDVYNKFVRSDSKAVDEDTLFGEIEEEAVERKERLKQEDDEQMLQSPDGSFDMPEDAGGEEDAPDSGFTQEPLEAVMEEVEEVADAEEPKSPEDKKFCCKKHSLVFGQSQTSIRMCASMQLYEQVSCDEPYEEEQLGEEEKRREEEERKRMKAKAEDERVATALLAHEADIKGKLLNKRRSMNPAKVIGDILSS